jgi:hypothetical protein
MNTHTLGALAALDIAVRTADLRRVPYDGQWIYLNRIGKRTRILAQKDAVGNGGTIRAAIKITWNPDAYTRDQMAAHVRRLLRAMDHFATMGSAHPFRRCGEVGLLIAGGLDESRRGCWHMTAPCNLPNADKVRKMIAR